MIDAFLNIYDHKFGYFRVTLDDEPVIDAAVTQWLDSGRTKDTLLMLTGVDGSMVKVLASDIASWATNTPESRAAIRELDRAISAESKAEDWSDDG